MPTTYPPCPLCLSTLDVRAEPDKTWFSGFRGAQKLVRCVDCSLVYLRDTESEVVATRCDDYVRAKIIQSQREPPGDRDALFLRRLAWAKARVLGRRVLDIGCGNGSFLVTARAQGWDAAGLDNSEAAREVLAPTGIDVCVADTVEFLRDHPASFDFIHMNHSLEHIPKAPDTVLAAHAALAKGGLLYVEVPNEFENLVYRSLELIGRKRKTGSVLGRSQAAPEPSPHLYFFNKRSLSRLAARAGFSCVKVHARRREPLELNAVEAAGSIAALLGAGFLLTLTAKVAPAW